MEPLERDELSNSELDELLPEWKAPVAPARMRSAVFGEAPRAWWRTIWTASIRVPVPALLVLAMLLGIIVWQRSPEARHPGNELQPVAELRPKIIRTKTIRSGNVQN
jgi:hypothetical protein